MGFINSEGAFAIQPNFESARDFQEGLAAVRMDGQWGFINGAGIPVIPAQFEQAQSFREGLAAVKIDGKWGFINRAGVLTIPPRFEEVRIVFGLARDCLQQSTGVLHRSKRRCRLAAVLLTEKRVAYINHAGKIVFDYFRH